MAELVLGNLGAAVGASLLPQGLSLFGRQVAGQAIGRAIGSLAGAYLDARYLSPPVEGPRIREFHLTESSEGASLPVVYGRLRVGAHVIWAAEFKGRREVEGGKGGPRTADYSYSLSFAVALCEELVDVETWKLTRLLRGQQGSEPANAAGAVIGARILFLARAEQKLEVAHWERGLELEWRVWCGSADEQAA